jgi:hypothetical protein
VPNPAFESGRADKQRAFRLRPWRRAAHRERSADTRPNNGIVTKTGVSDVATNKTEKIDVENVNHPGHVRRVDADMYEAMKRAFLKILPKTSPGLTVAEIRERLIAHLPEELFPEGAKAGWWVKAVQLDLEAKGVVAREKTKPLRLRKA